MDRLIRDKDSRQVWQNQHGRSELGTLHQIENFKPRLHADSEVDGNKSLNDNLEM
ncbi:hypothetical protein YC2023_069973 [Brassica napus]